MHREEYPYDGQAGIDNFLKNLTHGFYDCFYAIRMPRCDTTVNGIFASLTIINQSHPVLFRIVGHLYRSLAYITDTR